MATDVNALNGLFKEVYGDDVINLVPEAAKLTKMVPFVQKDKENGNFYHQPVILSYEHGFTYAAAAAGAFTLNNSISMAMKDAQVVGSQAILRSQISYDAAYRASNSKKAFMDATKIVVENMLESFTKRLEIQSFYGGVGIAKLQTRANVNATTTDWTISDAQWAGGIWAGMEGATFDLYQNDQTTKVNTNGPFTVSTVNLVTKVIRFTGIAADITAGDAYIAANPGLGTLYFQGANGAEITGLSKIITNTGTLYNISAATYTLWKGNTYDAGSAALTFGKVIDALAVAANRGLSEKTTVFLSPVTWGNIATDQAALRKFDGSYNTSKTENGTKAITFYSQTGEVELVPHIFVKEGDGFIIPMDQVKRLGATDITFRRPGRPDEIFRELDTQAGYELRVYADQAVFLQTPARAVQIQNIING